MKKLSLLLYAILAVLTLQANPITKQQAKEIAAKFLKSRGSQPLNEPKRAAGRKTGKDQQSIYVFNAENNKGFVMVAGDDRVETILGYTDSGCYDEDNMPENFRWWMEGLASDIESLDDIKDEETVSNEGKLQIHEAIAPLIKTRWNQGNATQEGNIYNTLCPTISGKHCVTGCVATAGAQVMYYHKWPKTATQSVPGYTTEGSLVNTSKDLAPITFNWDVMKTTYSEEDKGTASAKAVAELMLYCGYAAKMMYGLDGSSSSEGSMAKGMSMYFDYDPYTYKAVTRYKFRVSEWDEMMYNELKEGRPIMYSGGSLTEGGHVFLCDGYDGEGFYHFNWGWGGHYDGYFKLQATNPYGRGTGFTMSQGAIIGIQPNTGLIPEQTNKNDEWEEETIEGTVATTAQLTVEGLKVKMRFQNWNQETCGFGLGFGELNSDGSITVLDRKYESYQNTDLKTGQYFYNISFDVSTYELSEGTHKLIPLSILRGESEWKRCAPASNWFEVTVASDGTKSIVAHPIINLTVTDFKVQSGCQPGESQTLTFKIKNDGDNFDSILYMYYQKDDVTDYATNTHVKILSGNTKDYTVNIRNLEEGTYKLLLYDSYLKERLLATTTMTLKQELKAIKFDVPGYRFATIQQNVNVTVSNTYGDYTSLLYLFASMTDDMGSAVHFVGTAIEEGGSEEVTFYFTPDKAGTWNFWVCTDKEGNNVIGKSTVEFLEPPAEEAVLEASDIKLSTGTTTTLTLTITNKGNETYYREISAGLYKQGGTNTYYSEASIDTDPLGLEKGQSVTKTFTFNDLEEGKQYMIFCRFYPKYSEYTTKELINNNNRFTIPTSTGIMDKNTDLSNDKIPWYSLDGKRLASKPQRSGIYIHGGKKVKVIR